MYIPNRDRGKLGEVHTGPPRIVPRRIMNNSQDAVDWCNTRLRVGPESPIRGKVKLHRFQEDPVRDMTNPEVVQTSLMAASQVSKTFILSAVTGYHIDQHPCAILICGPTGTYNRRFIATKLEPMLKANPGINARINRNRLGNIPSTETTTFDGGSLSWATGKAPSTQKGHSSELVLGDEVDEYVGLVDVDNPLDLLLHRGVTFGARQRAGIASTPGIHKASLIESEFLKGTMAEFFVPCPFCGHRAPMKWSNVICPEKPDEGEPPIPDSELYGNYVCSECGTVWEESDRKHALNGGLWVPTVPDRTHHSYRLSQLASPFVSLMTTIREYMSRTEKGFTTQVLAEPFSMTVSEAPDPHTLEWLYGVSPPAGARTSTSVGIDVQGAYVEIVVLGFWQGEAHIRVLSHTQIARRGRVDTVADIIQYLWPFGPDCIFIDESFETDEVRMMAAMLNQTFWDKCYPVRGKSPSWNQAFTLTTDLSKKTKYLASDSVKYSIFETIGKPGVWSIEPERVIRDKFLPGLCSEHIVTSLNGKLEWEKLTPKTRNEVLDCSYMAWAAKRFRDTKLILQEA